MDLFLENLIKYDKDHIHENCQRAVEPYLCDPEFEPEFIKGKSFAASGLCSWVINIMKYYKVYCAVEPKRLALEAANAELAAAKHKLKAITTKINDLESELGTLMGEFGRATSEKVRCEQDAETTTKTIELANRLIGGLSSENVRWADSIEKFKVQEKTLPGDVLITAAFVSYLSLQSNNVWI